jgi:hypothetical protein
MPIPDADVAPMPDGHVPNATPNRWDLTIEPASRIYLRL